jgi:hypothetical protein
MRAAWYENQGAARDVLVVGEMPDPSHSTTPSPENKSILRQICRLDFLRERLLPRRLETERRGEARTGSEPLIQRPFLLRLVRAHDESACPADVFKRSQSVPALGRSAAGAHQPFGHFAEQYRQFALAPLLQFVV